MQFPKREDALAKVSEKELTAPLPEEFTTIIKGERIRMGTWNSKRAKRFNPGGFY